MADIQPNWNAYYRPSANLNLQGSPALDILKQDYQRREAQKAQDSKEFTSELAKLNFNGARDPDLPELQKDYGEILQTFQKYRTTNDPRQRAALDLQMRQQQNQFLYKSQQSKQANDEFHQDAALAHNPNADLDPSYWDDNKKRMQTSTFDPNYQKILDNKQNWLVPKSDPIKDAQEIKKSLLNTTTTESNRYNKTTGSLERVSTTSQDIDYDKFMKSWVQSHVNDPNKVRSAMRQTGETDPVKAVTALGDAMFDAVGGKKESQKVTGGGLTMASREELLREGARDRQYYSTTNQITPFTVRAKQIPQVAQVNPAVAKETLKSLVDIIPTKGLKGNINYDVKDGKVIIDIPRKKVGLAPSVKEHRIEVDLADPNFEATLQAKIAAEGANVAGYNQSYKGREVPKPTVKAPGQKHTTLDQYKTLKSGDHYWKDGIEYIKK